MIIDCAIFYRLINELSGKSLPLIMRMLNACKQSGLFPQGIVQAAHRGVVNMAVADLP